MSEGKATLQRIDDSELHRETWRFDNGGILSRTFQRRLLRDLRDARNKLETDTYTTRRALREELNLLASRLGVIELEEHFASANALNHIAPDGHIPPVPNDKE